MQNHSFYSPLLSGKAEAEKARKIAEAKKKGKEKAKKDAEAEKAKMMAVTKKIV